MEQILPVHPFKEGENGVSQKNLILDLISKNINVIKKKTLLQGLTKNIEKGWTHENNYKQ